MSRKEGKGYHFMILLIMSLISLSLSNIIYDLNEDSLTSVYVNYHNPKKNLIATYSTPEGQQQDQQGETEVTIINPNIEAYGLIHTMKAVKKTGAKGCQLEEDSVNKIKSNSSISIIFVRRFQVVWNCVHFSQLVRDVQVNLPQITTIVVGSDYEGDPGLFSAGFYSSPTEDTTDIKLAVYEVSMTSYNILMKYSSDLSLSSAKEGEEDSPQLVYLQLSESLNPWSLLYVKPSFLAFRYLFLLVWTCLSIYGLVRFVLLVGIPFTTHAKQSKMETRMSLFFIILYCICRAVYYGRDPFTVGNSYVAMTNAVIYYIAYWSMLTSFTILSLVYVQIVNTLSNCILWKARYILWGSMMFLLPFSLICLVVVFIYGFYLAFLVLAIYLCFLILFESIIIMHYGRKVIEMIRVSSTVSRDEHGNKAKKRISLLIISSSVLYFLSFFIAVISALPTTLIQRTPSNKSSLEAVLDICNLLLAFSMITTIVGFSNNSSTASSSSSSSVNSKKPRDSVVIPEKSTELLYIN